jgi:hypothetical protein
MNKALIKKVSEVARLALKNDIGAAEIASGARKVNLYVAEVSMAPQIQPLKSRNSDSIP